MPMAMLGVGVGRSTLSMTRVEALDGVAGGVVLLVSMAEYWMPLWMEEERRREEPGWTLYARSKEPTSAVSHLESKRRGILATLSEVREAISSWYPDPQVNDLLITTVKNLH
jgi:hypothetical protein